MEGAFLGGRVCGISLNGEEFRERFSFSEM